MRQRDNPKYHGATRERTLAWRVWTVPGEHPGIPPQTWTASAGHSAGAVSFRLCSEWNAPTYRALARLEVANATLFFRYQEWT
jgi:hypothetical protein